MGDRLDVTQGDTAIYRIVVTSPADTAVDLNDYVNIFFTIKKSAQDNDDFAIWAGSLLNDDISILDSPDENTFEVTIPSSATILMRQYKRYYWDAKLKDGAGEIFTVDNGTIWACDTLLVP